MKPSSDSGISKYPNNIITDLQSSGLSEETILKMNPLEINETNLRKYGFSIDLEKYKGYLLPYNNIIGDNNFARVKFTPKPNNFPKYLSASKENVMHPVHLYIMDDDYRILSSSKTKYIFTEGEKKTAKLSQTLFQLNNEIEKYASIGLGGVYMSNCPEFDNLKLKDRPAYIAFDADSNTNPSVAKAEAKFYAILTSRGASSVKSLSWDLKSGKGIDDYLANNSEPVSELSQLIKDTIPTLNKISFVLDLKTICEIIVSVVEVEHNETLTARFISEIYTAFKNRYTKTDVKKCFLNALKENSSDNISKRIKESNLSMLKQLGVETDKNIIPSGFMLSENGLFLVKKEGHYEKLCSAFIIDSMLETLSTTSDNNIRLKFNNKVIILPASIVSNPQELSRVFAMNGEVIDSDRAKLITKYISSYCQLNGDVINRKKLLTETGWYDDETGINFSLPTYNDTVVYSSTLDKLFTKNGSDIKQVAFLSDIIHNHKAGIIIPIALASTLIAPLQMNNVIVNFNGISGSGKTTTSLIGMSLFGNPKLLKKTFNQTSFAQENLLNLQKDIPVLIDEVNTAGKDETKIRDTLLELIYNYDSGEGRARGNKNLTLRDISTYRGIILITAEISMDAILDIGYKARDSKGVYRRVLEVNLSDLWNNPQWSEVYQSIYNDYGHIAPIWLKFISDNNIINLVNLSMVKHLEILSSYDLRGKENFIALVMSVIEILPKLFNITSKDIERMFFTMLEIAEYNSNIINEKLLSPVERFIEEIQNFVVANGSYFGLSANLNGNQWGKFDRNELYIITPAFQSFCKDNKFDQRDILRALEKEGILIKGRKDKFVSEFKIGNNNASGYRFIIKQDELDISSINNILNECSEPMYI